MLLITNGRIVTMDAERRVIRHGAVLIEGNRIKDIGQNADLLARYPDCSVAWATISRSPTGSPNAFTRYRPSSCAANRRLVRCSMNWK